MARTPVRPMLEHTMPRSRLWLECPAVFAALLLLTTFASAAEPADPFADLQSRVEQLEQDNRELRGLLVPRPGGESTLPDPLTDAAPTSTDRIAPVILDQPQQVPGESGVDRMQDEQISALQRRLDSLIGKPSEKTYPNVTVNGVFQADAGFFHQDDNSLATYGRIQDGADFRRARLSAKGGLTPSVNYFFQMDFAFFGRPTFTDLWVEQTGIPILGNVRVGQWKQPFSLEVVSSFRYTTFMERSLLFQPFTPFRHIGVGFYDHAEDLWATWAASVFRSGQDQFGGSISTDGGWGTAERVTLLPYWDHESNGQAYLHLGLGHFFNAPPHDTINFRSIPEFFVGQNAPGAVGTSGQAVPGALDGTPFFVATGPLAVNACNVVGGELLWVQGPFSLQSEWMVNFVDQGAGNPSVVLPGAYAQAGYFLTGEHRPYDRKAGAIDRVMPRANFGPASMGGDHGCGAWEIAARWSWLDLDDENVQGGRITDLTLGVNWFLNPYTKIVFNYIHSVPDVPVFGKSHTDIFGLRTQMDF